MTELEKFKCHKEVQARPMLLGEYNNYRGWIIPKLEDPETEGYLVVYESGYESWSPKKEFQEGYSQITSPLCRLQLEKDELILKLKGLENALENPAIMAKIPSYSKALMGEQKVVMDRYLSLLNQRFEFWGVK
jgi:hypothetical protein